MKTARNGWKTANQGWEANKKYICVVYCDHERLADGVCKACTEKLPNLKAGPDSHSYNPHSSKCKYEALMDWAKGH